MPDAYSTKSNLRGCARSRPLLTSLIAGSLFAVAGAAQDYQRHAPKMPAGGAPTVLASPPQQSRASAASRAPIIPVLKGMVFVSTPEGIRREGVAANGISTGGIEMLAKRDLQSQLAVYLGKSVSLDEVNEMAHLVVTFYRRHGHPLVDVTVPEQDVQAGTIQFIVTEFRVGEVRTSGNRHFSDHSITSPVTLRHGDVVNATALLGQLDVVNANPFRRVNLIYEPSNRPGYTDLVLNTEERFPLRAYGGYDNSGTAVTGRGRWSLGVSWGNAFGHDQQLSYQFTSSNDLFIHSSSLPGEPSGASFLSHSVSWSAPLPWRDSLSVFGAYEKSVPNVGASFGLVGQSGQASIRYVKTLPRTAAFTQSLQAGFDFKTTNNNLDFGGTTVSANSTEIDQFPVIYAANLWDKVGVTGSTTALVISPGGITPNNSNLNFQPGYGQSGRPFATANYLYFREDVTRLTKLAAGAVWSVRLLGQISNRALLNTEQLSLGGPDLLRGYDPYSILGDAGIVISNELRAPPFQWATKGEKTFWRQAFQQTQVLTFWDYASLHNRQAVNGVQPVISASSVGVGLRYNLRNYTALKMDYGWQLQRLPDANSKGRLLSFGVLIGN